MYQTETLRAVTRVYVERPSKPFNQTNTIIRERLANNYTHQHAQNVLKKRCNAFF